MIEELSVQFPAKECCVAQSVSRSGYYQWVGREQSVRAEANAELSKEIERVYQEHKGRYGSPRRRWFCNGWIEARQSRVVLFCPAAMREMPRTNTNNTAPFD